MTTPDNPDTLDNGTAVDGGVQTLVVGNGDDSTRLVRYLQRHFDQFGMGGIARALRHKVICVNHKKADVHYRLQAGDTIQIHPALYRRHHAVVRQPAQHRPPSQTRLEELSRCIQAVTPHFLVINKPQGWASQGGAGLRNHGRQIDRVSRWLSDDWLPPGSPPPFLADDSTPKLVHRLDKDTTGIMLLARGRAAARTIAQAFTRRQVRKIYLAVVWGVPEKACDVINTPVPSGKERHAAYRPAQTLYRTIDTAEADSYRLSLLALFPTTGRFHQIRYHMAGLGHPLWGDSHRLFQEENHASKAALHLHAQLLAFDKTLPDLAGSFVASHLGSLSDTLQRYWPHQISRLQSPAILQSWGAELENASIGSKNLANAMENEQQKRI